MEFDEDDDRGAIDAQRMEEYFRHLRRGQAILVLYFCFWAICGIVLLILAFLGLVDWVWVIFPFLPFIGIWWSGVFKWVMSRVMRFLNSLGR